MPSESSSVRRRCRAQARTIPSPRPTLRREVDVFGGHLGATAHLDSRRVVAMTGVEIRRRVPTPSRRSDCAGTRRCRAHACSTVEAVDLCHEEGCCSVPCQHDASIILSTASVKRMFLSPGTPKTCATPSFRDSTMKLRGPRELWSAQRRSLAATPRREWHSGVSNACSRKRISAADADVSRRNVGVLGRWPRLPRRVDSTR